jgi:1-acyl-sn-glycerol-3-phosphate acyltransferase
MIRVFRILFFALVVRPLVLVLIGLNVRNRERLPAVGPAIIIANHNSHLDTLVMMSLFSLTTLPSIRPVAAADYFLRNKPLAWFSLNIMGIIPIRRGRQSGDPLGPIEEALRNGAIVILYPEGTRGTAENLSKFKKGVWHLSKRVPEVPVIPVFLHGLGKALPRGEAIFVPFFCDAFVGNAIASDEDRNVFMHAVGEEFQSLTERGGFSAWV